MQLEGGYTQQKGFTLIEVVVGIALFAMFAVGVYSAVSYILQSSYVSRVQFQQIEVANEQLELARNLPYEQVGVVGGIPSGVLPQSKTITKSGTKFLVKNYVRNIDDPFDGTLGGSPNDTSPADYKKVQIEVTCLSCTIAPKNPAIVSTTIAPKALESASNNGALFVTVFDAAGGVIAGATVHVTNPTLAPALDLIDVTDASGKLQLLDLPPATESYHLEVTKTGYSTDATVTPGGAITNPVHPDATVAAQTVTNISFNIDKVGSIPITSMNELCVPKSNVGFNVKGEKLIGKDPNVLKFDQTITTNAAGQYSLNNLEWDTYTFSLSGTTYDIAGTIPTLPITLAPGATQNFSAVLASHTTNNLLITVKDNGTKLPLTGATVTITKGSYSVQVITGNGYVRQTDWSGGSGQAAYMDETKYFSQDSNISDSGTPGDLFLKKIGNNYLWSGELISSTIDFGSASNFTNIEWIPLAQPPQTGADSLKFQIATSVIADPPQWIFLGPDGTPNTYYTASNTNINIAHDNSRYLRYKVFMNTANNKYTPQLSEVAISFTSGCTPPGQAFFSGLSTGTYDVTVSLQGYQDIITQVDINGTTTAELSMAP
ncbi:MAG: prepilin-type N-terminal cleavage/methylation domain-containing protein [Candidatus Magasanikbacteria bacterium]|nr:prepilin-type N-terminal cleavage/methylation domain-containing protein [Candidatus Magasanikbacteria bacterium]